MRAIWTHFWEIFWLTKTPRRSAAVLLVLTAIYLIVELGFNARLLDVAGTPQKLDDLMGIEQWGRLISGFAVALAFWGFLAKAAHYYGWNLGTASAAYVAATFAIVAGVYWGEKIYVDRQVEATGIEQRQTGAMAVMLTSYLYKHKSLEGIPLTADLLARPEGKAFYALFAQFYDSVLKNAGGIDKLGPIVIRDMLENKLGGVDATHEAIYWKAIDAALNSYENGYRQGILDFRAAMNSRERRADEAWADYEDLLRQRRMTPTTVPPAYHEQVRDQVRERIGIWVPSDWKPWDRLTFQRLIHRKIESAAESEWDSQSRRITDGQVLPRNLADFASFLVHPAVQSSLRSEMAEGLAKSSKGEVSFPEIAQPLRETWTPEVWRQKIYEPMVAEAVQRQYDAIVNQRSSFEPGGANFCKGVDAVYALSVPAFALSVSIAGAIYHSSKVIWYLCYFVAALGGLGVRWGIRAAFWTVTLGLPLAMTNSIQSAPHYAKLMEHAHIDQGWAAMAVGDWIIRAQQLYYPANHWVHTMVLGGTNFTKVPLLPAHNCGPEKTRQP